MKFVKVAAVMMMAMWAGSAFAQGKIAVLDLEEAVMNTDLAQRELQALNDDAEYKKLVQKLEALRDEIKSMVDAYQKDQVTLSEEQKASRGRAIEEKQRQGQADAQRLNAYQQRTMKGIMERVSPTLKQVLPQILKEENIYLLLPRESVMHVEGSHDITAKVADKLNQVK